MKQHMMTHKLRDMPPHMFGSNSADQSNSSSRSPDHPKESASLRVKTEAELSPRSTTENSRSHSTRERERERDRERERERDHESRYDRRERSLPPQFQSHVDSASYHMMLERQQQLQMQQMHQQSSRHSPLHLSHFQRQPPSMAMSPPRTTAQASPQHIKNDHVRQKPLSMDIDQPSAKRQLCKFRFHSISSISTFRREKKVI